MSIDFSSIVQSASYLLANAPEAEEARSYLNKRLETTTQEQFGFGYFPPTEQLALLTNLLPLDTLETAELVYTRQFQDIQSARSNLVSFFEHHPLIMPYRNVYGDILALVGRSLLSDTQRQALGIAKYKNTHFVKGNHLFGLYEAKQAILVSNFTYVVEGQFDVIKAHEKGLKNVVAVGSSNLSDRQLALLTRYTNNIRLLFDSDDAGQKGKARSIQKYSQYANITAMSVPEPYKDLDEYLGNVSKPEDLELREDQ